MKLLMKSTALLLVVLLFISVLPAALAEETGETGATDAAPVSETPAGETTPPAGETTPPAVETTPPVETAPPTEATTPPTEETTPPTEETTPPVYEPDEQPVYVAPPIDYNDLTYQIVIANGLNQDDYTKDSVNNMLRALEIANAAMNSYYQSEVDAAEAALAEAIAALVKMDYVGLRTALAEAEEFNNSDELNELWVRLVEEIAKGKALLGSDDQLAIDAVTAQINEIIAQLTGRMEELSKPQIVTQEVIVEVPPSTDFCNISIHRLWPVLFFVSLALNVVLVPVVLVLLRKKKRQTDDTPLIDYDIDDDIFDT